MLSEKEYKKIERESPQRKEKGSHIFKSKVDRLPSIERHFPGPGEYDIKAHSSLKPLINPIHQSRNQFKTLQTSKLEAQSRASLKQIKLKGQRESIERINGPPKYASAMGKYPKHIGNMAELA